MTWISGHHVLWFCIFFLYFQVNLLIVLFPVLARTLLRKIRFSMRLFLVKYISNNIVQMFSDVHHYLHFIIIIVFPILHPDRGECKLIPDNRGTILDMGKRVKTSYFLISICFLWLHWCEEKPLNVPIALYSTAVKNNITCKCSAVRTYIIPLHLNRNTSTMVEQGGVGCWGVSLQLLNNNNQVGKWSHWNKEFSEQSGMSANLFTILVEMCPVLE